MLAVDKQGRRLRHLSRWRSADNGAPHERRMRGDGGQRDEGEPQILAAGPSADTGDRGVGVCRCSTERRRRSERVPGRELESGRDADLGLGLQRRCVSVREPRLRGLRQPVPAHRRPDRLAPGSDLALEAVLPAEVDCVPLRKWSLAGDEVYWSFTTGMAYFMKALGLTTTDGMSVAVAAAENRPAFPVVLMVHRVRGIGTEALIPAWVQARYLAWTQPIGADPTPTPNPSAKPAKPTPTWAPLLTAQQTIGGKPVTVLDEPVHLPDRQRLGRVSLRQGRSVVHRQLERRT